MKIKWSIEKQQGNFRPVLEYKITLEEFEKDLAMHTVRVTSRIPKIPESIQRFCLPDTMEREADWKPKAFHVIYTPSFSRGELKNKLILPYQNDTEFAMVEDSFKLLRQAFETELQAARDSMSVFQRHEMCLTDETRQKMATDIAASKMLNLVGF